MADFLAGDVIARLRADTSQFNQALQDVIARLAQLNQAAAQSRSTQSQGQQSTRQLSAAYLALAQSIAQQTQAYTQVNQASLAYRQQQDQAREATRRLREEQRAATEQARAMGAASRASGGSLGTVLSIAGGIGVATGIGAIVSQMKDLAVQTVQVGIRFETLRASLSAIGGGPGVGAQQFQMLTDMAQRLGVALEPLARGWRTLTAAATQAGVPLADQQRLLSALATEARRLGVSNEELGRIFQSMSQTFSKGKVSMEELRGQLGEALPTAMAAAAKGMGQTTETLIKLVETGTLGAVSFGRALTRGLEQLQSGTGKMVDTTQGALNNLATAWKTLQDTIMKGGLNAYLVEAIQNIQNALEWTTKAVAPDPRRVGLRPLTEMGATPDQAQHITGLERVIESYKRQAANAQNEAHRTQYTEMAARAQEELEQRMAAVRATREQQAAQGKVTEEANKTKFALEQQADFVKDLTKALADATKQVTEFRQKAALAPELYGRMGGTKEEAETFLRGLSEAQRKTGEGLTGMLQGRAPGTVVPPEQMAQVRELLQGYGASEAAIKALDAAEQARMKTAREAEQAKAKAAREAEQAQEKAARQAIQDQEAYQQAIDKTRMDLARQQDTSLETLRRLTEQYGLSKEATDLETASKEAALLVGTRHQAQAEAYLATIEAVAKVEAQLPQLRREAAASAVAGAEAMQRAQDTTRFEGDVTSRLAELRAPREERESLRLRRQAERQGITITPEYDAQLKLIDAQKEWNTLMDHAGRIADQAAQTITSGLMRMVDGTVAVGEGFRAMAKSILDSMAEIALNQTFKTLFNLGLSLLGGAAGAALGGGVVAQGGSTSMASSGGSSGFIASMSGGVSGGGTPFQHGGVVHRPTLAMIGEGPAHTLPEYVLNRQQMQGLMASAMRSGPGAGGQAVTVINVASKEQADVEAARERAMGRQVVVNYVLEELGQGSGSRISQVMRSTLR